MSFVTACDNDLDQEPTLDLESSKLVDYGPVLNGAYYYQTGVAMPQLVMGDFRADNMLMIEAPFTSIDTYNSDLAGGDMSGAFFGPVYSNLYKSILSANNVILNSDCASISNCFKYASNEMACCSFIAVKDSFAFFSNVRKNLSHSVEIIQFLIL